MKAPIYKGGGLDTDIAASLMGIHEADLRELIAQAPTENAQVVVEVLDGLWELTGGDDAAVRMWFSSPYTPWMGLTPRAVLGMGKLAALRSAVQGALGGEISGS